MEILLTLIIPTYNTNELTQKLLEVLDKQMQNKIEVIVIDDFSDIPFIPLKKYKWLKLIRTKKNNGTASASRNIGIDNASGKYIGYIDGDDMISDDYISKILKAIQANPDIIFLSWENHIQKFVITMQPPKWNCAVWCRVYKRDIIGNVRFDENLRVAEDWKFNEQIKFKTKICIKDVVYYYNNGRKGSILNG